MTLQFDPETALPRASFGTLIPVGVAVAFTAAFAAAVPAVLRTGALEFRAPWLGQLGIELAFRLDGLALLFALLISGIGIAVAVYVLGYLRGHRDLTRFHVAFVMFMVSMLGLVTADDVILVFVFWELTSLSSFLLIGFDHERAAARSAALQALLVTCAGGLALLAGLLILGHTAGTYSLSRMSGVAEALETAGVALPVVLLVAIGAMTKSALVPFHFWLPRAMEAPAPVSAYLHSATMVKAGIYLIARMNPHLGALPSWEWILTLAGAATAIVGAVAALRQIDLKKILAWSTVSTLGILAVLLAVGTAAAATAAMILLVAHALYKACLFMVAGAVDHHAGERDIRVVSGLARALPVLAIAALVAAASAAGIPPFAGAAAKDATLIALLGAGAGAPQLTAILLVASTLLLAAILRASILPFFGRAREGASVAHDHGASVMAAPALVLALVGCLAGVLGLATSGLVRSASAAATAPGPTTALASGTSAAAGWIGAASVVAGMILAFGLGRRVFSEGLRAWNVWDSTLRRLLEFARWATSLIHTGSLRHYLAVIVGFTLLLLLPGAVGVSGHRLETTMRAPLPAELAALLLTVGGALLAVGTRSRFAAIVSLGAVGLGVSLFFLFNGGPDLAMTQIVVDILMVILFMLALRRLPAMASYSSRATRFRDAIMAGLLGGTIGLLSFLGISAPNREPISSFFVENALSQAHGRNIVNVILVDFRAIDTLGEIAVLAVAALGAHALLSRATHVREGS